MTYVRAALNRRSLARLSFFCLLKKPHKALTLETPPINAKQTFLLTESFRTRTVTGISGSVQRSPCGLLWMSRYYGNDTVLEWAHSYEASSPLYLTLFLLHS